MSTPFFPPPVSRAELERERSKLATADAASAVGSTTPADERQGARELRSARASSTPSVTTPAPSVATPTRSPARKIVFIVAGLALYGALRAARIAAGTGLPQIGVAVLTFVVLGGLLLAAHVAESRRAATANERSRTQRFIVVALAGLALSTCADVVGAFTASATRTLAAPPAKKLAGVDAFRLTPEGRAVFPATGIELSFVSRGAPWVRVEQGAVDGSLVMDSPDHVRMIVFAAGQDGTPEAVLRGAIDARTKAGDAVRDVTWGTGAVAGTTARTLRFALDPGATGAVALRVMYWVVTKNDQLMLIRCSAPEGAFDRAESSCREVVESARRTD
jgi:hypothetical protein